MYDTLRISRLWIHPVKSLPGIAVDRLTFDAAGPVDDRRWMLVDETGRFLSQRALPELARFGIEAGQGGYRLRSPAGDSQPLPRRAEGETRAVTVWKDSLTAREVSADLSAWFSHHLGRTARLVHLGEASERRIPDPAAEADERVGFADGYPLLLCNQASLDALNARSDWQLEARRFRPNLVIEGLPADRELALGRLNFASGWLDLLKPCVRCNIPAIDPDRGEFQVDIARRLKQYSRFQGQTVFGVNAVARGLSELAVGDTARFG